MNEDIPTTRRRSRLLETEEEKTERQIRDHDGDDFMITPQLIEAHQR